MVPLFALVQSRTPNARAVARDRRQQHPQRAASSCSAAVFGIVRCSAAGTGDPADLPGAGDAQRAGRDLHLHAGARIPDAVPVSWMLVQHALPRRASTASSNIPDEGPALLVCNHVSYMDALIIGGAIRAAGALRHVLQDLQDPGAAASSSAPPRRSRSPARGGSGADASGRSTDIDAALADGRTGLHLSRRRADDATARSRRSGPASSGSSRSRPVPVVPMALRGMWASMWSRRDTRLGACARRGGSARMSKWWRVPPVDGSRHGAAAGSAGAGVARGCGVGALRLQEACALRYAIPIRSRSFLVRPSPRRRTAPAPPATTAGCARPGSSRRAARAVRPWRRPATPGATTPSSA